MLSLRRLQRRNSIKTTVPPCPRRRRKQQNTIHVHVEADITKGKYHDYDTFLGAEAATYLKLYIEQRQHGSADGRNPPEDLTDESPLIRDETRHKPRPIGAKQIRKAVHHLYVQAGLIKQRNLQMYDLRVHSLRKYFKTQLLALGVSTRLCGLYDGAYNRHLPRHTESRH